MKTLFCICLTFLCFVFQGHAAGFLYYSMTGSNAFPTSAAIPGLSGSQISRGNAAAPDTLVRNFTPSTGYTTAGGLPASGTFNAQISIQPGPLNVSTSSFFGVTLTSGVGSAFTIDGVSFGSFAAIFLSAPTTISLYASSDGFVGDYTLVSTISAATNFAWFAKDFGPMSLNLAPNSSLSFRLYGSDSVGNFFPGSINWRIDDLGFIVTPVPEPGAAGLLALGGTFFLLRRLRRPFDLRSKRPTYPKPR